MACRGASCMQVSAPKWSLLGQIQHQSGLGISPLLLDDIQADAAI